MSERAVSKVTLNGTTLIDVTQDTVNANSLFAGVTATGADGVKVTGTYTPQPSGAVVITHEQDSNGGTIETIAVADGGITAQPVTFTSDGTYTAPSGTAYSQVTVSTDVTVADLAPYQSVTTTGDRDGMSVYGATLTFDDTVKYSTYFKLNSGVIGDYTFRLDGNVTEPVYKSKMYVVELTNIAAKYFKRKHTIEVSDSEGVFLTYEFYVYSYCYTILNGESYAETLKNIAKTMYRYGQACAAYYGT